MRLITQDEAEWKEEEVVESKIARLYLAVTSLTDQSDFSS